MIRGIDAVIFDMDGTLVDSEHLTIQVVQALLSEHGLPTALDETRLHGVTWAQIAADLVEEHPVLVGRCTGDLLHRRCHALWLASPPPTMPGIERALAAAADAGLRRAIATSSNAEAVDVLTRRDGWAGVFDVRVTADDISRSKPDPEIFLLAAERLGVPPGRCLVFEDSLAGLQAAKSAGMPRVAVLLRSADPARARALSDLAIVDYERLDPSFFGAITSS